MRQFTMAAAVLSVVVLGQPVTPASSHNSGLNAAGCHNDRKRKSYHCHRAALMPALQQSAISASNAFVNCNAAKAAGGAPVRIGDPGYGAHLDRDGDGIGCE